jgi:hypothetical protein
MADAQLTKLRETSPNILFLIARSKNQNIVVYEAKTNGNALDTSEPVTVYWLDIDPEYQKAARAKGVTSDRVELGTFERQFAYGLSSEAQSGGTYKVKLVAFPDRPVYVSYDTAANRPVAKMDIQGKRCLLNRIYVSAKDRMLGPPKVEYVDLNGLDDHGAAVTERITP